MNSSESETCELQESEFDEVVGGCPLSNLVASVLLPLIYSRLPPPGPTHDPIWM